MYFLEILTKINAFIHPNILSNNHSQFFEESISPANNIKEIYLDQEAHLFQTHDNEK